MIIQFVNGDSIESPDFVYIEEESVRTRFGYACAPLFSDYNEEDFE